MACIQPCDDRDRQAILAIVNSAADAYRGVIPPDHWHEPYMASDELDREIAAGVVFWGYVADGSLVGVMGVQSVRDVALVRHAYVLPTAQRGGVGGALLEQLRRQSEHRQMLVGTWAAASWAIHFYERHGFGLVAPHATAELLRKYWNIPQGQIETSVVLANPSLEAISRERAELGVEAT